MNWIKGALEELGENARAYPVTAMVIGYAILLITYLVVVVLLSKPPD